MNKADQTGVPHDRKCSFKMKFPTLLSLQFRTASYQRLCAQRAQEFAFKLKMWTILKRN